jgi:hypothetical protein
LHTITKIVLAAMFFSKVLLFFAALTLVKGIELDGDANLETIAETVMAEYDAVLSNQLQERNLGSPGVMGDRCGNNNPCVEGMDCLPSSFGMKRCQPISCWKSVIEQFQEEENFDPVVHKQKVFEAAGITEEEYRLAGQQFAPLGSNRLRESSVISAVIEAMKANPINLDKLTAMASRCYFDENENNRATQPGSTTTYGFWTEFGAGINGGFATLFAKGDADANTANLVRCCVGGEAGLGGEVAFAWGFHGRLSNR